MKNLILSSVFVLIASSAAHAQDAVQWKVSDGGNGHWYQLRLSNPGLGWTAAQNAADAAGGYLATLTSAPENSFVFELANVTSAYGGSPVVGPWIGGRRTRDQWSWVNGDEWIFVNWLPPNPDGPGTWGEDRTCLTSSAGQWNDFNESGVQPGLAMRSYVVEWSADCNNDGIVDYGQCRDGSLPDFNGNNVPDCCETGTPCVVGNYPVQWRVVDGGNGHWYQLSIPPFDVTWPAANVASRSVGGRLGQIESAAERQFLFDLCASSPAAWNISGGGALGPWIGGLQQSGAVEPDSGWIWTDGTPVDFEACRFVVSYPSGCGTNEDRMSFWCPDPASVYVGSIAYETSDFPAGGMCGTLGPIRAFVTEWSADCNNDGIVDYGQILQGQLVDADANGVPDVCEVDPCPGDITNGGTVDATDLSIVLAAWGTNGQGEFQADIDDSGLVDGGDLALVLGGWGPCNP